MMKIQMTVPRKQWTAIRMYEHAWQAARTMSLPSEVQRQLFQPPYLPNMEDVNVQPEKK